MPVNFNRNQFVRHERWRRFNQAAFNKKNALFVCLRPIFIPPIPAFILPKIAADTNVYFQLVSGTFLKRCDFLIII